MIPYKLVFKVFKEINKNHGVLNQAMIFI